MNRLIAKPLGRRICAALLAIATLLAAVPSTGGARHASAAARVYEVGPDKPYERLSDVPFERLNPGDTVLVHWREEPYREKVTLSRSGTADAPITLRGVPDESGRLPVIDGEGAAEHPGMETNYGATAARGLIVVALRPGDEWGYKPRHIVIEGLDIRGAHRDHAFYSEASGQTRRYTNNAAGIFVERGENITVRGNIVHGNSNGVFVASGGTEEMLSRNFLLEGNLVYDNGNIGSDQQHNVYVEAMRAVYQYNVFGPWKEGAGGNLLKDRSSGTIVRYNTFYNGAHALDLVEGEDAFPLLSRDPAYRETYVYGNIIVNDERTGSIVHYGGDLLESMYRKGTLHFYNNTIVAKGDKNREWNNTLFQIERGNRVDFRNNIVYTRSATPGAQASTMLLSRSDGDLHIGNNWISPGYALSADPAYFTGTVRGAENVIEIPGNDPGFVDLEGGNYRLQASSGAIDLGDGLSGSAAPGLPVIPAELRVFNQHTFGLDPRLGERRPSGGAAPDFGAYEFGTAGQPIVPEPLNFPEAAASEPADPDPDAAGRTDGDGGAAAVGGQAAPADPTVPAAAESPLKTLYPIFDTERNVSFTTAGDGTAGIERLAEHSDSLAIRLSRFAGTWSVPKQIAFDAPVPLDALAPGDVLELDVAIEGKPTHTNPTTLLFYFNGIRDASHWVGSGQLKLGETNRVRLDLSGIKDHLGGSLTRIGVLTGYGWPQDASVRLSGIRLAGTGERWAIPPSGPDGSGEGGEEPAADPPLAAEPAYRVTFTEGGAGGAEAKTTESGGTAYTFSRFPGAWSVPKQMKLEPSIPLDGWQAGDRLAIDVTVEGKAAGSNPVTLLFYFNGAKDATHWVGTAPLKLGEKTAVELDLARIIGNLGGAITQVGLLTGYGWPQDASVTIGSMKRLTVSE